MLQLPSVAQKPDYALPSDEMARIYGSLWQNHFKIVELTEIMRQKNDQHLALLLNRIRIGTHTEDDIMTIQNRQVQPDQGSYPQNATHIFAYNKDVNNHNTDRLNNLTTTKYTFNAKGFKEIK